MFSLSIQLSKENRSWKKKDNFFYTGIFNEEILSEIKNDEDIELLKENLNGSYALIITLKDKVIMITDYLRSVPIFYEIIDKNIRIFDDMKYSISHNILEDKIIEYRNSGYIFGNETLKKNVYQSMRNTKTTIELINGTVTTEYIDLTIDNNILGNFNEISNALAKDLFEKFNDKIIYIPLSDGTDSKYILSLVKKSKLKNVICYTYGRNPNCGYAKESKKLANQFGFEWKFVKYTGKKWKNLKKSNELREYMKYSFQYSTYVHLQDFIAVKELLQKYTIEERKNMVFMPGHTGSIGGGNLPSELFDDEVSYDKIRNFIKLKDFNLWNDGEMVLKNNSYLTEYFDSLPTLNKETLIKKIQYFDLDERQAKLIVNSLRVYEFHGTCWYLPLMDRRVITYFENQLPSSLLNKTFYKQNVVEYFKNSGGCENGKRIKISDNKKNSHCRILAWNIKNQFTHDFCWYSLFSIKDRIEFLFRGNIQANAFMSLIANETIREMMRLDDRFNKKTY